MTGKSGSAGVDQESSSARTEAPAPKLIPPDLEQCQVEKPNGNTFMTLGGIPGHVRCTNKPVAILTEVVPGKDGERGSMSACAKCWKVAIKQLGAWYFSAEPI